MVNACRGRCRVICALRAQPTMAREKRSRMTARYSQPSCVHRYVISVTHVRPSGDLARWDALR
jgi:hypothetical protein